MRHVRKKATLASLVLAALGFLLYEAGPFKAVFAIANLSDPQKLATLGKRGANPRLNEIVFWLDQARGRGLSPERAIRWAQLLNGTGEPRASLVKESLTRNLRIADELGALTPENGAHLARGQAPTITRGPYAGQKTDVDHIVPVSLAPEIGNELANLELLPKPLNLRKSNEVGARQLSHAARLAEAGLLSRESLVRVRRQAGLPPR